jgi:hypothetical protein
VPQSIFQMTRSLNGRSLLTCLCVGLDLLNVAEDATDPEENDSGRMKRSTASARLILTEKSFLIPF